MPDTTLEDTALALLQELKEGDPVESITRAQAMMVAATGFLTRCAGPEIVAAQLRADADMVAAYVVTPGQRSLQSGGLH